MTDETLADRARRARNSGAELKIKVSNVRSRNPNALIAVVEGRSDVGPYRAWFRLIGYQFSLEFVAASGKAQILDFGNRIDNDLTGLGAGTYMFVDRDFDGLRGQPPGDNIFCTGAYSIENYLVSAEVLKSILEDEFRCPAETHHRNEIIKLFHIIVQKFNNEITEANRRLFGASRLGIGGSGIEKRISKYVEIMPRTVRRKYGDRELKQLIVLDRELTGEEISDLDIEFQKLDPFFDYRGKFLLNFFLKWLDELAEEKKKPDQTMFPESGGVGFSPANLSPRSLASRASIPDGLENFVKNMSMS